MARPLTSEEREVFERVTKALDAWRVTRWYLVISGILSAGIAIFLYSSVLDLADTLSDLYASNTDDKEFFESLTGLVLSLSISVSAAFVAAVYGAYGVFGTVARWNGPPGARAIEIIARRELESSGGIGHAA